jgi:hypothetical protein
MSKTQLKKKCINPHCKDTAYEYSPFCIWHRCSNDGCCLMNCGAINQDALHGEIYGYCRTHQCSSPGCLHPKGSKSESCVWHQPAYITTNVIVDTNTITPMTLI